MNADFAEAVKREPNSPLVYDLRGQAKANLKDAAGAMLDYAKAIALYAQYAPTYLHRGLLRIDQHDKSGACADFNKAATLGLADGIEAVNKYCK